MPIMRPDGPGTDTKGSANTKCTCFVHTHDRGASNPSQPIDLSPYLTAVSVSNHLTGGGSATLSLPAVDHIEDIIAAGDVINIYFNTNRSNENIYNVGNVRTFFGYIESVTKSISVDLMGSKITTYTINCKDFSYAIRQTQIYSNEHLASQSLGDTQNVVRKDVRSNLGGIAMLSRGIALMGAPRKMILQNLMRFVGFGGQWALPTSYSEALPGGSHSLKITEKDGDTKTIQDIFGIIGAAQVGNETTDGSTPEEILGELASLINDMVSSGRYSEKGISPAWNDPDGLAREFAGEIKEFKKKFKAVKVSAELEETGGDALLNNTFFQVHGADSSQYQNNMATIATKFLSPDAEAVKVTKEEQGLEADILRALHHVIDEIGAVDEGLLKELNAAPRANQYAEPLEGKYKTPIKTIFNILCLDYMEKVKGFWANASFMYFQNDLFTALQQAANSTMNELFFDLRPTPTFMVAGKDGVGVPMEAAMPMVPAVVLRMKPFTNYPVPEKDFTSEVASMVVGGFNVGSDADRPIAINDQLVINSGGVMGTPGPEKVGKELLPEDLEKIQSAKLEPGGDEAIGKAGMATPEMTPAPVRRGPKTSTTAGGAASPTSAEDDWKNRVNKYYEEDIKTDTTLSDSTALVDMARLAVGGAGGGAGDSYYTVQDNIPLAKQATKNYVTLPRPVFRSPDNNRITKELDMSQTEYLLGVTQKSEGTEGGTTDFYSIMSSPEQEGLGAGPGGGAGTFLSATSGIAASTMGGANPLFMAGTSALDFMSGADKKSKEPTPEETNWHVLDYMVVNDTDVRSETYSRGDFGDIYNVVEYWGSALGGVDHQRYFMGAVMPIVTPLSIYRFGIRPISQSTPFIQAILTGGVGHNHQRDILLRWVVLQDMWAQHNHEYFGGSMSMRGMPGLRVGYRVDRPERGLSMYVDQVSHTWNYPGEMTTSIGFSRGQPMAGSEALPYAPPVSNQDPEKSERQNLGKVFKTSSYKQWGVEIGKSISGTFTGPKGIGRQIEVATRPSPPAESMFDIINSSVPTAPDVPDTTEE